MKTAPTVTEKSGFCWLCLCALVGVVIIGCSDATAMLVDGLAAYYPLNGTAQDMSGNGNNGIAYNTQNATDRWGNANGAMQFNGVSAYVDVGSAGLSNNPIAYTQIAWIKTSSAGNDHVIITRRQLQNYNMGWCTLMTDAGKGDLCVDADFHRVDVKGASNVANAVWHMLAGIRSSNQYTLFVDGVQAAHATDNFAMPGSTSSVYIGRHAGWSRYFNGLIDDVSFFNKALTSNEIWTLYRALPGGIYITTPAAVVSFDMTAIAIAGTNSAELTGTMWWTNQLSGAYGSLAASQSWAMGEVALHVGANPIYVYGTNTYGDVANDHVIITRGPAGTGVPFVKVTNTAAWVTYDVTSGGIAGTNNLNVVGSMHWSNTATLTTGTLPATPTWNISGIVLAVGVNAIVINGTNAFGAITSDSVTITRGPAGTGGAYVKVTNSPAWFTYDVAHYAVAGTNNVNVVGTMNVFNAQSGNPVLGFAAAPSWHAPAVNLAVGVNTILVYGTNAYGAMASDSVTITRGPAGTGVPYLDVTNSAATVTYDVAVFAVAGTNNVQVMGGMLASNAANGAVTSFAATASWTSPLLPLEVGANELVVIGTNLLNQVATDRVIIRRGGIGTGAPYVDITNVLTGPVNNAVSTFTVAGTNNPQVVGTMWWVNVGDGSTGVFDASPNWRAAVPLQVGLNTITVQGTNLWTVLANDTVVVMRLPGVPANISATDGTFTNQVRINFAASVGATKYMVCRAPGNAPTNFTGVSGEITATTYDDATVAAGQQYYYAVQAGSPYGWSVLSAADGGFALLAINAGEWKYKGGAKVNKKGKLTGKDILKGNQVNPSLMPYFAQGWQIGLAGLVNGSLTNWNGPYSLTPNKSQKLWQVKDPAKGTPKVCLIKYRVNDKQGDKLDYQLWTNMPADKVVYILPTNLLFGTATLLNEQDNSEPPVQFRLQPAGKADKQGWQPLDATVIECEYKHL